MHPPPAASSAAQPTRRLPPRRRPTPAEPATHKRPVHYERAIASLPSFELPRSKTECSLGFKEFTRRLPPRPAIEAVLRHAWGAQAARGLALVDRLGAWAPDPTCDTARPDRRRETECVR